MIHLVLFFQMNPLLLKYRWLLSVETSHASTGWKWLMALRRFLTKLLPSWSVCKLSTLSDSTLKNWLIKFQQITMCPEQQKNSHELRSNLFFWAVNAFKSCCLTFENMFVQGARECQITKMTENQRLLLSDISVGFIMYLCLSARPGKSGMCPIH